MSKKGFYFKKLSGDFNLRVGDIYTANTVLNGSVANVAMHGRIGLRTHDYDLSLLVVPNITSSLPAVATLVGGPIVGAATFAANELFKHTIQPAISYRYKVTGPWQNPKIEKL